MLRLYGQADADPAGLALVARRPSGPGPRRSWRCTGSSIRTRIRRRLSSLPSGPVSSSHWPRPIARWRHGAADGSSSGSSSTRRTTVRRKPVGSSGRASSWRALRGGVVGVWLEFRWDDAHARLAPEPGLHRFHDHGRIDSCRVESTDVALTAYRTPEGIGRPGSIDGNPRRVYRRDQRRVDDVELDLRFDWHSPDLANALARVIEFRLTRSIEGLLDR